MKNLENDIKIIVNLFNTKNFDSVISKTKRLIKQFPEYVVLYNILGSAYQNIGDFKLAKNIFTKGQAMDPGNIAIKNNLANVYKNTGDIELSEKLFEKIIELKPDYINAYINLGNLKRDNNNFRSAINLYERALKINDRDPVIFYSLALAYQGLGSFDMAIDYAQKTLKIDPKFTQADMLISQSTKYENGNQHYKEMSLKISSLKLNDDQKINILFALAKAEEDMNQIEKSFEHFDFGNKLKRKSLKFDINEEIKFFDTLKDIFKDFNYDKITNVNSPTKNLIFILGMPRSGTSLVEQIITSHSNVFSSGELPQLSKIVQDQLSVNNVISKTKIHELFNDDSQINKLSNNYYDYLKRFNATEHVLTDKAPLNFRWIGLIKILFPKSKIVHCSRNPKDNCLSLYKNYFEGGLNFSYNQKELVSYYKQYSSLMNFWNDLLPDTIYEANYEKMIKNSAEEIRKIIKFCNLPWEESCLSFHKNKAPIKTLSTAQARKPIYKSSVNSFDKFSPFLEDLNKIS